MLIISTFLLGLLIIIAGPMGNNKWRARFGSIIGCCWGKLLVRATLLPVRVEGKEKMLPDQSYVIVANHQSCYDIFLMFGYLGRSIRWMMKSSLMNIFVLGKASRISGHIAVDTSSPSKVHDTYERACKTIVNGVSLVVFPEGHRSLDGHLAQFKRGAFTIADQLQIPVVPVSIHGTYEVMPKQRDFKFAHWHPLEMIIHEPIYPIGKGSENITFLQNESRRIISQDLETRP